MKRGFTVLVFVAVALMRVPALRAESVVAEPLSDEAKAIIATLQAHPDDEYTRQRAFIELEALREPASAAAIRAFLDDRDEDTRAYSVRALAAVEGAAAVPELLKRLQNERSPRVRIACLLGLEPLHAPQATEPLIKHLRDRNKEVRMAAVDVVSRLKEPRVRARAHEAILVRWKRERDRDVRRVLEAALKRVGPSGQPAVPARAP